MKKLLVLTLTLLLPLAIFARGNKQNKAEQNLQQRNEQTISHLISLSRSYKHIDKAEIKEKISQSIDREIEHWYMENMQTVTQETNENADPNTTKQQLAAEIKGGKVPEMMLKSVSEETAAQLKKRAEAPVQWNKTKSTGKGLKPFKK